jgi:GAF domain-containing protein
VGELNRVAATLAEAARTIDARHSLEQTLDAIVHAARLSVPGVEHVGISTIDKRGRVRTRAATDDLVRSLDDLQYRLGEGPCLDALRVGRIVSVPKLADDGRWPRYVAEATSTTELKAQLAVRLSLDEEEEVLGGLNMYSTHSPDLDPDAEGVAELFATHAAIALGRAQELGGLQSALASRRTIGQGVGILMERYQMSEDRAFAFMTRASSHGNVKLRDLAQELVDQLNEAADQPPVFP